MNKFVGLTFLLLTVPFGALLSQTENKEFREIGLSFANGDAVYSGTLSLPSGQGVYPAVILVSGTGLQDRDWVFNRGTFKMGPQIARHLNSQGIAVFRYDDRGAGKSTGSPETETSFEDLIADVNVAVDTLRNRDEIDEVGLCGHSLGGILSILSASEYKNVDFVISMAGSFVTGEEISRDQARTLKVWRISADQTDEEVTEYGYWVTNKFAQYFETGEGLDTLRMILTDLVTYQINNLSREMLDENLKNYKDVDEFIEESAKGALQYFISPHRNSFFRYSAATGLPDVECPVAVIFGEADNHVTVESNKPPLIESLKDAKTHDFTLRIIPDMDHGFSNSVLVKEGKMMQEPLDFISNWILAREGS